MTKQTGSLARHRWRAIGFIPVAAACSRSVRRKLSAVAAARGESGALVVAKIERHNSHDMLTLVRCADI
jgi:ABC-type taurine transport system substrate-binding protein